MRNKIFDLLDSILSWIEISPKAVEPLAAPVLVQYEFMSHRKVRDLGAECRFDRRQCR